MKTLKKTILITTTILSITTAPAMANELWAAVGGFVGGLVIGNANNSCYNGGVSYEYSRTYSYGHRSSHICRPVGYYKWVNIKTEWIEGRWDTTCDSRGRQSRRWIEGYWITTPRQIWVEDGLCCH